MQITGGITIGGSLWSPPTSGPGGSIVATGGTETTIDIGGTNYKIHTFTSNGSFDVTSIGSTGNIEYLVVAGGGGGGGHRGGGGGAGFNSTINITGGYGGSGIVIIRYPVEA
jgi:hypothetical protein